MPYTREAVAVRARDIRTGQSLPPGPPGSGVRPRAVSLSSWSWRVPALGAQLCAAVLSSPSASVASRHNVTRRGCVPSTRRGRGVLQCPSRGRSSPCGARQGPRAGGSQDVPSSLRRARAGRNLPLSFISTFVSTRVSPADCTWKGGTVPRPWARRAGSCASQGESRLGAS